MHTYNSYKLPRLLCVCAGAHACAKITYCYN